MARIAARAIRHSKRQAMYSDTKTKKMMRARTAFSVMVRPHDELTELTDTSSTETPASSASWFCTAVRTSVGSSPTWMRMNSSVPDVRV